MLNIRTLFRCCGWTVVCSFALSCSMSRQQSECLQASEKPKRIALLLDTDPALGVIRDGLPRDIDDGLAIIEAINAQAIDLRGITTVFGNSELHVGTQVARKLVSLKQSDVPVVPGAARALDDASTPPVTDAVRFLAGRLREGPHIIAAIGPLTNIASLIANYPDEASNIERVVVVMGRSPEQHFFIGTFGPIRDLNFIKDPLAARMVFESNVPIVLAPFELSVQVLIGPDHLRRIASINTPSATYVREKSHEWIELWHRNFPQEHGFHPWDSAAIAYLLRPDQLVCESRGYRFRDVLDAAHGVGNERTGKSKTMQPWLELAADFPTRPVTYCHGFKNNRIDEFIEHIVQNIY